MIYYNDELRRLFAEVAEQKRLNAELSDLQDQRRALMDKARELEGKKIQEQADVDKLEGRSLAAFFYNVVGKMDEKLTKEREEAYAAAVKWDAAQKELAAVEGAIGQRKEALARLAGCEKRYASLKAEKLAAMKAEGGPDADAVMELEERIAYLENQKREIREAMSAGRNALGITDNILSSLDSADGWNTWDMFGGGGIITHVAKHGHLDDAQGMVEDLQVALRRFKTELADVTIHADMQVNIDGFLRFTDWFFDGIFADWAVRDRISQSQSQVSDARRKIESVLTRLDGMHSNAELEQRKAQAEIDALVVGETSYNG